MPRTERRTSTDPRIVSGAGWRAAAIVFGSAVAMAFPAVASAVPTLGVAVTFPATVTVGQTLPASFTIANQSSFEDPSFKLCKGGDGGSCAGTDGVVLTPSCAQVAGSNSLTTCTSGGAEPGVFQINQPAAGGSGTACSDTTFLATPFGDPFGRVRFAPTGGQDVTLSIGEQCRVEFTLTVLRMPTLDASGLPGVQTAPIVTASANTYLNHPVAGGSSTVLTVNPSAPPAPTVIDTDPNGPANDNAPKVKGAAAAGTTVNVYSNAACAGTPLTQGSAATFGTAGLTVAVPDNSTTTFAATVTDPTNGLTSGCSTSSRAYVEDSTPPETTIVIGPSGATDDDTPVFTFSSNEPGAKFACRLDTGPVTVCVSPLQLPTLTSTDHTFVVRAADAAGNTDPTPASRRFTVGSSFSPSALTGCRLKGNNITGTPDNDDITGTAKTDIIVGLSGGDLLRGLGGRDCLFGQGGTDRLSGGPGADLLFGGPDNDTLSGDAGNDRLSGDSGRDRLNGGSANDTLSGGAGPDKLTDTRGVDVFSGGAGIDLIDARDSSRADRRRRDRISCGAGRDTVLADPRDIVARDCERVIRRSR